MRSLLLAVSLMASWLLPVSAAASPAQDARAQKPCRVRKVAARHGLSESEVVVVAAPADDTPPPVNRVVCAALCAPDSLRAQIATKRATPENVPGERDEGHATGYPNEYHLFTTQKVEL